jgi:hypothetical protein
MLAAGLALERGTEPSGIDQSKLPVRTSRHNKFSFAEGVAAGKDRPCGSR